MICRLLLAGTSLVFADPKSDSGSKLYLNSEPSRALISINGEKTGKRTPALVEVPAGIVRVMLEFDGYAPAKVAVPVQPGALRRINIPLRKANEKGGGEQDWTSADVPTHALRIFIEEPPSALIFIDGIRYTRDNGEPFVTPIEIPGFPEGIYTITIAKPGFQDRTIRYRLDDRAEPILGRLSPGNSRILSRPYYSTSPSEFFPAAEPGHGEDEFTAVFAKLRRAIDSRKAAPTAPVGGRGGEEFAFMPRDGALLIGFNVSEDNFAGHRVVVAVQPVFLTARGRIIGPWFGTPGQTVELIARPGYAVGAVAARGAQRLDGFQVVFVRIRPTQLDFSDSYRSEFIGGTGGQPAPVLGGKGAAVVGIVGHTGDRQLHSLGLILAK